MSDLPSGDYQLQFRMERVYPHNMPRGWMKCVPMRSRQASTTLRHVITRNLRYHDTHSTVVRIFRTIDRQSSLP